MSDQIKSPVRVEKVGNFDIYFTPEVEYDYPDIDFESKEDAEEFNRKFNAGEFAYFCAKIHTELEGMVFSETYLGQCIYDSYEDFYTTYKEDYYRDMVNEVVEESLDKLERIKELY